MSNLRKKIGIVGHYNGDRTMFGINPRYVLFFTTVFNADVELISPSEMNVREHLDLIVIPGGPDVDWKRYLKEGEQLDPRVGRPCNERERFDHVLLPKYIEKGIPVFGICRGHQSIAVIFGASLTQHMEHESNSSYDRTKLVHKVISEVDNLKVAGYDPKVVYHHKGRSFPATKVNFEVNSIHHQAVAEVPADAILLASYDGKLDKSIEALHYPKHKITTVQWHPEEIHDKPSIAFINHLMSLK